MLSQQKLTSINLLKFSLRGNNIILFQINETWHNSWNLKMEILVNDSFTSVVVSVTIVFTLYGILNSRKCTSVANVNQS